MNTSRYHLQSPILRRVQRHASVATLFRASSAPIQRVLQTGGTSSFEIFSGDFASLTSKTDNESATPSLAEDTSDFSPRLVPPSGEISAPNKPAPSETARLFQNTPKSPAVPEADLPNTVSPMASPSMSASLQESSSLPLTEAQTTNTVQKFSKESSPIPLSKPGDAPQELSKPAPIQKKSSWSLPNLFRKWQERRSSTPSASATPVTANNPSPLASERPPENFSQPTPSVPVAKTVSISASLPVPSPIQRETSAPEQFHPTPPITANVSSPVMSTPPPATFLQGPSPALSAQVIAPTLQTARPQRSDVSPVSQPPQAEAFSPGSPPPSPETPSPVSDQDSETPEWRRLQTIMRKHQEKGTPIAPPESPEASPEPRGVSPSTPTPSPRNVVQSQISATPPTSSHAQAVAPAPLSSPSAQTSNPTASDSDPNWSRLQNIMRKHQEHQDQGEKNEDLPDTTPAPPTPPSFPSAKPTSTSESLPKGLKPRTPSTSDVPSSSGSGTQAGSQPSTSSALPGIQRNSPVNVASGGPSSSNVSFQTPENAPSSSMAGSLDKTDIFEPFQTGTSSALEEEGLFSAQEAGSDTDKSLPLEQFWPVQRKEQKITNVPSHPVPTSAIVPLPETPPLHPEEEAILRKVSQSAKTGQPTDSHVELILPRAPRPTSISKPATQPTAKSVEEKSPISSEPTLADSSFHETTPFPATNSPAQPIQRTPGDTDTDSASFSSSPKLNNEPTQIATEIGPLPSDLWDLLGEVPPAPSSTATHTPQENSQTTNAGMPPASNAPPSPSKIQPTEKISESRAAPMPGIQAPRSSFTSTQTLQRQVTEHAQSSPASAFSPGNMPNQFIEVPPSLIQREEMTQPGAVPATPSASNQSSPTLSEQDLDKLARQVYAEIRHKLSIERERTRGWLR